MKRLSKEQVKEHGEIGAALHGAQQELEGAIQKYNQRVTEAYSELAPFVTAFNEQVDKANDFIEAVHDDQQAYFDEKSDKWQEGDAGSAYADWMGTWEFNVEEAELEEPSDLELADVDIESFDQLATECSS